ncbi:MAG: MFS transporter [Gammaproteobacteria bacterium]
MSSSAIKTNFFVAALPLFLVILIDGVGLGLIAPVLTQMVIGDDSNFLPHTVSSHYRYLMYDIIFSSFMFCWFFGAAFLGDLSDQIGRKKSLFICLTGTFIGYLLSAFSILLSSVLIFILGRIISGLTAGSQSIAQAAIIDLSTDEHKARNIGIMLFFASLGFILGPLIGGFFSNPAIVHWFNTITPFYIAAGLAFLNIILLWIFFRETFEKTKKVEI